MKLILVEDPERHKHILNTRSTKTNSNNSRCNKHMNFTCEGRKQSLMGKKLKDGILHITHRDIAVGHEKFIKPG